jgi:hypothetical protein
MLLLWGLLAGLILPKTMLPIYACRIKRGFPNKTADYFSRLKRFSSIDATGNQAEGCAKVIQAEFPLMLGKIQGFGHEQMEFLA